MAANVPDSECAHCIPDCNYFVYEHSLSHEPFRDCDDFNLGVTSLCEIEQRDMDFRPVMWGDQVRRTQLFRVKRTNQTQHLDRAIKT